MKTHHIDPTLLTPTSPFSHIVLDDHYAHVAGRVAADIPGGEDLLGDVRAETRLVLESIAFTLAAHGLAMDAIVRVDVHLTDMDEIGAMDEIYAEFFTIGGFPARTCTQSTQLFGGSRVEITCTAQRPAEPGSPFDDR